MHPQLFKAWLSCPCAAGFFDFTNVFIMADVLSDPCTRLLKHVKSVISIAAFSEAYSATLKFKHLHRGSSAMFAEPGVLVEFIVISLQYPFKNPVAYDVFIL